VTTDSAAQVRGRLIGVNGALAIAAMVVLPLGLRLGVDYGLDGAHAPAPATLGTAVSGLAILVDGPVLMRRVRRRVSRRPMESIP
jgi:hypothetical protein